MGQKDLKHRKQFTSTLRNELYASIHTLSKETSVPISRLLDAAVAQYLTTRSK